MDEKQATYTRSIPGELSAEDAERLGIKKWSLSPEAEAEIRSIEEQIALGAAHCRNVLLG